ncbi:hypothetical protein Tco_0193123, partial [Tanacetum coccineum]
NSENQATMEDETEEEDLVRKSVLDVELVYDLGMLQGGALLMTRIGNTPMLASYSVDLEAFLHISLLLLAEFELLLLWSAMFLITYLNFWL